MTCLIIVICKIYVIADIFPTISTIPAHMVSARRKMQLSLIDQERLIEKIHIWKQEDRSIEIFFRPKSTEAVNNDNTKDNIEVEEQEMKFNHLKKMFYFCRDKNSVRILLE